jgi:hypothetical protein
MEGPDDSSMSMKSLPEDSRARFSIAGPEVTEAEILAVFLNPFPGRGDLVEFYLRHNGGSRDPQGCIIHCGNPAHKVTRDHLEKIRIECFLSISRNAEERMLPFAPMLRHRASRLRTFANVPEMVAFLESHMPIAADHCGDNCWINLDTGRIQYMLWDSWKEGPIEIAASFGEFVTRYWIAEPIQMH